MAMFTTFNAPSAVAWNFHRFYSNVDGLTELFDLNNTATPLIRPDLWCPLGDRIHGALLIPFNFSLSHCCQLTLSFSSSREK